MPLPPATSENTVALIPAYFERRHLREVVQRVTQQLPRVLVVDDGSTDGTGDEAVAAGAELIRHPVNRGKGAALKTGLAALQQRAGVDYAVMLDGDGQHVAEEIPAFLAAARGEAGLIVGNRMTDVRSMPFVRKLTNRYMSWRVSRLCGQAIPDTQCGFRLIAAPLFEPLVGAPSNNYDFETEMLVLAARRGFRIGAVPVSTVYGEETSKINPLRDTVRFFQLLRRLQEEGRAATK